MDAKLNTAVTNFNSLPDDAHVRPNDAIVLLGVSIATFWRLAKRGQIKTHKLTERTTTVKAGDLRAFMNREAANDE